MLGLDVITGLASAANDVLLAFDALLLVFLILIFYEIIKLRNLRQEFAVQLTDLKTMFDKHASRDIVLWTAQQLKTGMSNSGVRHMLYEAGYADADEIVQRASALSRSKKK